MASVDSRVELSSNNSSNGHGDSPHYERQRSQGTKPSLKDLLAFDEVSTMRRVWWHLPPDWRWDAKGGPQGQIYSSAEDFPGVEYPDFTPERRVSLGQGYRGEVRRRLCNGKFLACKKTSIDPEDLSAMQDNIREIEALKKLSHQHISQLAGIFIHDNDLYSLSYPVAEMDLQGYLDLNRTLDPTWVNSLIEGMGCLSNALAYAHAAGVKHADIHCGNIVIIGGTMILIDWGLSRLHHSPL
jgi:serine/threonine protein kinase